MATEEFPNQEPTNNSEEENSSKVNFDEFSDRISKNIEYLMNISGKQESATLEDIATRILQYYGQASVGTEAVDKADDIMEKIGLKKKFQYSFPKYAELHEAVVSALEGNLK